MYTLNQSPAYRRFVRDRDKALEVLHIRAQRKISDTLRGSFAHALSITKSYYHRLIDNPSTENAEALSREIAFLFSYTKLEVVYDIKRLRRNAFTLSKSSESEVLAQLFSRPIHAKVSRDQTQAAADKNVTEGGSLDHRVGLYLDRVRRDLVHNAQQAAMITYGDKDGKIVHRDEHGYLLRAYMAFPKARKVVRPKCELKPPLMKEAIKFKKSDDEYAMTKDSAIDMIDEDQWAQMLEDYTSDYVPKWRGPKDIIEIPGNTGDELYAWELERSITQDFVQQVRDGQIDAAKENGINDFVWIAIIDAVTDDCCTWRDGLLTSEIEQRLRTDKQNDECQATVPAAHFNCRCTLAPASDDIPKAPNDLSKEFEDWLNT